MPQDIQVTIEERHIVGADPAGDRGGPLRLALQDAGYTEITIRDLDLVADGAVYALDAETQEWIDQFQAGASVGPVGVQLTPAPPAD